MKKKLFFKMPLLSLAISISLLFLISPLSHSLSHALQDDTVESLLPAGAEHYESSLEEETLVGFDGIGMRKMGNGRKRVAMKRIMRRETATNDEREEDEEISSRISGKKKSPNKSHQTSQANHQETISATRPKDSRHVKAKPPNSKRVVSTKDKETQRLLKAAKEIANLMHKDYKDWAHRKPPINNHEPLH